MAQKKSKAERDLDSAIALQYARHANRKSISVLQLGKVNAEIRALFAAGGTLEHAVMIAVIRHLLPIGTRVSVGIEKPKEWSGPERFQGRTGVVIKHDERNGVPPAPAVLVQFDEPVDLGWGNTQATGQWFAPADLWHEVKR
jgi:hypothetical protein